MKVLNYQFRLKKQLVNYVGAATASVLLSLPALAQPNVNLHILNSAIVSRTGIIRATTINGQLIAQSTTSGSLSLSESQTSTNSILSPFNSPVRASTPKPKYLDPNPPAEVPSPSLLHQDPTTATQPSRVDP